MGTWTYLHLEADVVDFDSILEAKAQVEILKIESIIFEDVELSHSVAQKALRHG